MLNEKSTKITAYVVSVVATEPIKIVTKRTYSVNELLMTHNLSILRSQEPFTAAL